MDELREYVKKLEEEGYITKDGTPLRCLHCKSTNIIQSDESFGPMGIEEYKMKCNNCLKHTGHWVYGNWQID